MNFIQSVVLAFVEYEYDNATYNTVTLPFFRVWYVDIPEHLISLKRVNVLTRPCMQWPQWWNFYTRWLVACRTLEAWY
jgi:hypothetical protein